LAAGSETKKGLKCSCRRLAAIVPKDEFIEVYLELGLAHTVVRANEPLLEIAYGSIGKGNGGLRTFSQFRAQRLDASDVFKAVCLAKTSYTCRMNDLAKSWIRIFPLKFLP
jgi:hypothetical protein